MITRLVAVVLALAVLPAAHAEDPFAGTWECRIPGEAITRTPPILWIQHARGSDPSRVLIEVDGFAREMSGFADLSSSSDGWSRVAPETGAPFMLRRVASPRGTAAPAMELRREAGPTYRCLRLPLG